MTWCLSCSRWGPGALCDACRVDVRPGTPRLVDDGLRVVPGLAHSGTGRRLVHRLKYMGLRPVADLLAVPMTPGLPSAARALVPVPRMWARRLRYGVDPAAELASALSRATGLTVVHLLVPPLWHPSHAARPRDERPSPRFGRRGRVPAGAVLVDDVVTSGATLTAAARAVPAVLGAVTATGA